MAKTESSPEEDKVIQPYITALGALTVWWASLENALVSVVERLAEVNTLTAECLLDGCDRASGRANIVKMLALRPNPPSEEWQDCVVDLCNLIGNGWGSARNRLIHDDWSFNEEKVFRSRVGKTIQKPNTLNARKTLVPKPPSTLTHWEIYDLTEKAMHATLHLMFLSLSYKVWREKGTPVTVSRQAIWLSKDNQPTLFPQGEDA